MSTSEPAARRGPVVDCDVHTPVPTVDELAPHLADHWVDYLREVEFRQPIGVSWTYPAWASDGPAGDPPTADVRVLSTYYGVESQQHPFLVQALAGAVNDWVREACLDGRDGHVASIAVPPQHADIAAAEIRRVARDRRFVQVLVPARSWEPYGGRRFWPIWEAAAECGVAVAIGYGGSLGTPPTPVGWVSSYYEEYAGFQQVFAAHVASLVANGVFNRFPDLRVVLLESGWTWLPSLFWRMDSEWKSVRREVPWLEAPPSEYVRRHVRLSTQPIDAEARYVGQAAERLGSDEMLLFGSDHPRATEPTVDVLLARLTPEQRERVLWRNAWETYGLTGRPGVPDLAAVASRGEAAVR